ncbi:hypothetical protein V1478_017916 [Vespula squamosa]|uniref:Uncharacterized protein n=1 Tax=Vespula squamosa TaxID=30214 RepID=A0ABD1ZVK1_VESSQ
MGLINKTGDLLYFCAIFETIGLVNKSGRTSVFPNNFTNPREPKGCNSSPTSSSVNGTCTKDFFIHFSTSPGRLPIGGQVEICLWQSYILSYLVLYMFYMRNVLTYLVIILNLTNGFFIQIYCSSINVSISCFKSYI